MEKTLNKKQLLRLLCVLGMCPGNVYREESNETETRWNRFQMAPKRHENKNKTQKSRNKSGFFSIF